MAKKVIYLLMISVVVVSCQYEGAIGEAGGETGAITAKSLSGEWIWVRTEGSGIAGPYERTAIKSGDSETRKFVSGSQVEIRRVIDGIQSFEKYTYWLSTESNKVVISYFDDGTLTSREFIQKAGDKIVFSNYEACCDNTYETLFKR